MQPNSWHDAIAASKDVAVIVGDTKVAFEYWGDGFLGGFYDDSRVGDVPAYHLVVYTRDGKGWEQVFERATWLDLSTMSDVLHYWCSKIHKALETKTLEEAVKTCTFLVHPVMEEVSVA